MAIAYGTYIEDISMSLNILLHFSTEQVLVLIFSTYMLIRLNGYELWPLRSGFGHIYSPYNVSVLRTGQKIQKHWPLLLGRIKNPNCTNRLENKVYGITLTIANVMHLIWNKFTHCVVFYTLLKTNNLRKPLHFVPYATGFSQDISFHT